MSRQTEEQQASQHGASAGAAEHHVDHEAEHRPDVAHRASRAGLERHARVADAGARAPAADPRKQHDAADVADFRGIEASMQLGARQLQAAADEILRIIARPVNEAGIEPQLQQLRARIGKASTDFYRLNTQIGSGVKIEGGPVSGMTSLYTQLHPALGAIETAFNQFKEATARAEKFVTQHAGKLEAEQWCGDMARYLGEMRHKLGLGGDAARERPVDSRSGTTLLEEALGANLTALHEAIGAVRSGMTSGDEQVVQGDVRKVIRHANAISALLQQNTDPKLLKTHKRRVDQAVQETVHLENEAKARPAIAESMRSSELGRYRSEIQAKIGH
ncbi:MAG TPA: hypothetical protein VFT22_40600 [Kofleriaceae bacterium]|nr:hypothetical protein [Kofleriaceae bacterium]